MAFTVWFLVGFRAVKRAGLALIGVVYAAHFMKLVALKIAPLALKIASFVPLKKEWLAVDFALKRASICAWFSVGFRSMTVQKTDEIRTPNELKTNEFLTHFRSICAPNLHENRARSGAL